MPVLREAGDFFEVMRDLTGQSSLPRRCFRGACLSSLPTIQTPAQPKTAFLSQTQPITVYFPNSGKLTLTAGLSDNYTICTKHQESFMTSNKCQTQSSKSFVQCITLAKELKRRKTVTVRSRFNTTTSLSIVFSLSTLNFKTVDWSLYLPGE